MGLTNDSPRRLAFRHHARRRTGSPHVVERLQGSPAPTLSRLSYFTVVHLPMAEVEAGFRKCADTWLPVAAYTANRTGMLLLSQNGINLFGRQRIRKVDVGLVGPFKSENGTAVFNFTWQTESARKAPFLDGRLEIAPLTPNHTHMALDATYEPSPEIGDRLPGDRGITHRIAQATFRDFAERMARRLEQGRIH